MIRRGNKSNLKYSKSNNDALDLEPEHLYSHDTFLLFRLIIFSLYKSKEKNCEF